MIMDSENHLLFQKGKMVKLISRKRCVYITETRKWRPTDLVILKFFQAT